MNRAKLNKVIQDYGNLLRQLPPSHELRAQVADQWARFVAVAEGAAPARPWAEVQDEDFAKALAVVKGPVEVC